MREAKRTKGRIRLARRVRKRGQRWIIPSQRMRVIAQKQGIHRCEKGDGTGLMSLDQALQHKQIRVTLHLLAQMMIEGRKPLHHLSDKGVPHMLAPSFSCYFNRDEL